ncbi:MAG: decaprenylphospho-beta-D-ribofuranose 2-oxidase, partial [Frankiaceae bacterium]|nr:decaprenylphospho-beta-D-ribofuranose 2-oxidase [Frankiaceae bacterium]
MTAELLTGWGRTAATVADVSRPTSPDEVLLAVKAGLAEGRGVLPRGLARSYGDAALNAGGAVIELSGLNRIHTIDADAGLVTADA